MMREIKYRSLYNGVWWHVTPEDDDWEQFWAITNKETMGQFTSLLDKNGKEMYEGDIVTVKDGMMYSKRARTMIAGKYQVYWDDDRWGLNDQNGDSYDNGDYYRGDDIDWHQVTIIGNIYENSDLFKD